MTHVSTLKDVQNLSAGLPILGHIVTWKLTGIDTTVQDAQAALNAAGFTQFTVPEPSYHIALRRALEEWIEQHSASRLSMSSAPVEQAQAGSTAAAPAAKRDLIRLINTPKSKFETFVLVAENVDLARLGLRYGTSLRILLEKKTGVLMFSLNEGNVDDIINEQAQSQVSQLAGEITPLYAAHKAKLSSADLSLLTTSILFDMGALKLRKEGGVYFVPERATDALLRLQALIETDLPRKSDEAYVSMVGVVDAQNVRSNMSKAVHASILDEVRSLAYDVQVIKEREQAGAKVRETTLSDALTKFKDMQEKIAAYRDLLEMRNDEVQASIAPIQSEIIRLMTGA